VIAHPDRSNAAKPFGANQPPPLPLRVPPAHKAEHDSLTEVVPTDHGRPTRPPFLWSTPLWTPVLEDLEDLLPVGPGPGWLLLTDALIVPEEASFLRDVPWKNVSSSFSSLTTFLSECVGVGAPRFLSFLFYPTFTAYRTVTSNLLFLTGSPLSRYSSEVFTCFFGRF
jgi:hypothetical protein